MGITTSLLLCNELEKEEGELPPIEGEVESEHSMSFVKWYCVEHLYARQSSVEPGCTVQREVECEAPELDGDGPHPPNQL